MQYVIDALYVQNLQLEKPVLEQNSIIEQKFLKYLEIIVTDAIDSFEPQFSIKLRFVVARALLFISGKSGKHLETCLD